MSSFGWQYLPSYHDLCSGSMQGCMNIFIDSKMHHMATYPSLFFMPQFNFNNYSQYPTCNTNNYWMLDPNVAVAQFLNQNPTFNLGGSNMQWTNPIFPQYPMGPGATTPQTAEEITAQQKYNRLYSLVNQLKNYDKLSTEIKAELQAALLDTSGSYNDKYTRLKTAYDKVGDNIVKKFLKEEGIVSLTDTSVSTKEDAN